VSEPASEPAAPALRVTGLSLAYGERWVLRDISLELVTGGTLAVLGPNGAGKSTLLRIVATLLRPTEGSIEVLGAPLPDQAWKLRGRIGFLGHQPLLYRDLDARENLAFHGRLFGLRGDGAERAEELLDGVGLAARARTRVDEMSAGMVRRLAVCRALLHEPDLLVLDEPFANLDPAAAAAVAPLLGPAPGRTRVVVSHDVEAALADADRVLGLERDGTVAIESAAAEVDPGRVRAIYSERAVAA
jgi:heme exporter protein A